jgi:hypothetical protein
MSDLAIRALLANYLGGILSLRELDDSLTALTMGIEANADAVELGEAILLRLDEYSSGAYDEQALRAALTPFVTNYTIHVMVGGL